MDENKMDIIASLAKRRGFIFPGSEIYGGLAGTWDYGPLGVELKNNVKREFWRASVWERDDTVGIDAAIMMNPTVWEASGHLEAFTDPLVECKTCHTRLRADHEDELTRHMDEHRAKGESATWTEPRTFNLMVEARLGVIEGEKDTVYLRGEITQGAHVNFKNILDTTGRKLPFGVAQIGKAFRNEITPGNLTFRSREFEQMEVQYYIRPDDHEAGRWFEYWKERRRAWYIDLGVKAQNLRFREHAPDERAHYARSAVDIEYHAPFGWKECEGIHHRGEWDLTRHTRYSKTPLSYFDEETGKHLTPWVIETSGGVDRAILFFLLDAYREEQDEKGRTRTVLALNPRLAPFKAAVFPLLRNKLALVEKARMLYNNLRSRTARDWMGPIAWDDRGNIGKRYWAQDEIGTPWCITVDFQTLDDETVTVRDRDTTKQERIHAEELGDYLADKLG
ncbi:MAG: glycine--tRNA ligase [Patescibacteria group bacterium]